MPEARAYAAQSSTSPLAPHRIDRRDPGARDVEIDILFCGVCHSDLHTARGEWKGTKYPCVPGHEILGRVTQVGKDVTRFKQGDFAAVGCLVDSCQSCASCQEGLEQFCLKGATWTYNSADKKKRGAHTLGGYSTHVVVDEHFCLRVPSSLHPPSAAPLLCAGITMYSPLKHWGAAPGRKVGIVGLGGLGHMGVKLSSALGAETAVFTTSPSKTDDAKRFGATHVVLASDKAAMKQHSASFDLIIDTVSASHHLDAYTSLLARDGTLVLVGIPPRKNPALDVGKLISKRRRIAGSAVGGIPETQEMLDFCGERGIACDVETIAMQQINEAYERMLASDVRYRFVIDMASLKPT